MNAAILLLAGASTRFNAPTSKQLYFLKGKQVFSYSLDTLSNNKNIGEIVVVVNESIKEEVENYIKKNNISAKLVLGGSSRQESVKNAIDVLQINFDEIVLIHDGARPLISDSIIKEMIKTTQEYGASTTYLPAYDTMAIKSADGTIEENIDREKLVRIQTPQAFKFSILKEAHESAKNSLATDDATLVRNLGYKIKLVLGDECLLKITTLEDVKIIEGMIKND